VFQKSKDDVMEKPRLRKWLLPLLFLVTGCSTVTGVSTHKSLSADDKAVRLAQIGSLFESQGRTEKAIAAYEEALALDPSNERLSRRITGLRNFPSKSAASNVKTAVADVRFNDAPKQVRPAPTHQEGSSVRDIQLTSCPQGFESLGDSDWIKGDNQEFIDVDDPELIGKQSLISAGVGNSSSLYEPGTD
jgi:tetratricopeptide (TPR) repeat protein